MVHRRRPALCLAVLAAALTCASGCGTDCSNVGPPLLSPSFSVDLALPPGDIPADIMIRLEGGGISMTVALADIGESGAASACTREEGILCQWGEGPGTGTFDATAAGYAPVHLDLEAEREDCNGMRPDYQSSTLAPQQ